MPSHTVRVLCEARSQSRSVRDSATGEVPFFWRGSSVVMQLGLTDNGQHLLRAGVGTIIVEVKRLDATSADDSLMRKEYAAAACDATFTAADWAGGAKQLLAAAFTLAEAAISAGTYRLIVRHVAPDESEMTYLSTELRVLDPQSGSEGIDAPPVAWSYLEALPVVRADVSQSLTSGQKATARGNIGAALDTFDDLFDNETRLHHLFKALFPFAASADPAGSFVGVGGSLDSMGTDSGVLPHLTAEFTRRFGLGAVASSTFSSANGPTESQFGGSLTSAPDYTGGAALVSSDFTYLPNGQFYSCPVGSTTTESVRDKSITVGFTRLRCFFGRRAGGGTITFTVTQNGAPLATKTANTGTGTAGTIGYVDFVLADGLATYGIPTLVTSHSGGTNHYLGSYLFLRSGFVPVRLGLGGSTIDQQAAVPLANITDFAAATSLALLIHASKGDGPGDMAAHATRMATALPAVSHLFIGNSPSDSGLDQADSATMKAVALDNGFAFFDGYTALRNYSLMTSLGWNTDTTHLSMEARQYQAGIILNRIFNRLEMLGASASLGSVRSPVGRHEIVNDFLRNTTRRANLSSTNQHSSAGSGWTVLKDRGSHDIAWTTAPVAGNWAGTILLERHRMHGAFPMAARWQLMETANGAPQISAKIAFGYESGYPPATLDKAGLTWELGYDSATTPWIRFELHDGTGGGAVGRQVSPKFYLPLNTAAGNSGYVPGGTIWHNWALKYDGNGNSTSKRVRVWCSPSHPVNAVSSPVKPVLVADWTFTVGTAAFLPSGTPFLSFAALCTGASPAASGSMQLQTFEVDHNFENPAGINPFGN